MDLDWSKPIMFEDGRFCRYGGPRSTDAWIEHYTGENWDRAVFTAKSKHVRYLNEATLPKIVNQPPVDMEQPLYWLDDGMRAFVRETHMSLENGPSSYTVDDPSGRLYHVLPDGQVQGLPPRVLGNVPNDQLQAEARVAIKKAQRERAQRREQEALDQLADLNPDLFGAF